jgi:hypothetical protein
MPYDSVKDVPEYVPKAKRRQWLKVFNSAYAAALKDGKGAKEAEQSAFAQANAVAGPNAEKEKAMRTPKFDKFIPFAKVDEARREVWGIVTAEVPDKDNEVCDYLKSKPYYEAVISEMGKATEGGNYFPLRYMHQLEAVGKCIAFDFRDEDREIFMGFKVVDDEAWDKVMEKVLTGFSHGGALVDIAPDPVFEGCKRYTANPTEISLVDNPCLATAHFAYVKKDGTVELRKFSKVLPAGPSDGRLEALESQITLLKAHVMGKAKTKRVDGEELAASAFLIVGDPEKPETWLMPVEFEDVSKTRAYLRDAVMRTRFLKVGSAEKNAAFTKHLNALCQKYKIDLRAEMVRQAKVADWMRKSVRIHVNRLARTVKGGNVGYTLGTLDNELGQMAKGLSEVSRLSEVIQGLCYLAYNVTEESEWEGDESPLPGLLAANVDGLLATLLRMVEEESEELRADLRTRMT